MFKIGDFSKLSRVSVKALRHYDELGLLKPTHVDHFTSYRYYAISRLPRLNRILALKDLGFSLDQIARLLEGALAPGQMREILRMKQSDLRQHLQDEQARLARVEARLRLIEQEDCMPAYEVLIKQIETQNIIATRALVAHMREMPERCRALFHDIEVWFEQHGVRPAGPAFAIYYNEGYTEHDIDIEAAMPIALVPGVLASQANRVGLRELAGVATMASVVHHGSFDIISQAYIAIVSWIAANGYRISGPCREIYLSSPADAEPMTEIQFPVEPEYRLAAVKSVLAPDDLTRLTERSRQALEFAREEAQALRHTAIGGTHLLRGLARERNSFAAHVLRELGVTLDQTRAAVAVPSTADSALPSDLALTEDGRRVFLLAAQEAKQRGHGYIGTEHILLALMHDADPAIVIALGRANLLPEQVSARVEEMLRAQKPGASAA